MSFGKHLREFHRQHGADRTCEYLSRAVSEGKVRPEQISIRDLAESYMGEAWAEKLHARRYVHESSPVAVDASGFVAIAGQLMIDRVKGGYNAVGFVCKNLISDEPITNGNLGSQVIPWLGGIADAPSQVEQQQRYPYTQFGAQYITAPPPKKMGEICALSFEMIYSDLTGQVYKAAQRVGERVAIWEEEEAARVIYGITNNHSWNGTTYNTYQASTPWINTKSGISLVDWNEINEAEQLFAEMTDPVTGKPIDVNPNGILVMPRKKYNARRAMTATNTRSGTAGAGTSGNVIEAPNPLDQEYPVYVSKYGYQQVVASGVTATNARDWWILADFKEAFAFRTVHPMRTREAIPGSDMDFNRDIPYAIKAHTFRVAYVRDPRFAVKIYNA
jgi:hypothetical protein